MMTLKLNPKDCDNDSDFLMMMMVTMSPKDYDDDLPMMMRMNSLPKVLFIMFSMFLSTILSIPMLHIINIMYSTDRMFIQKLIKIIFTSLVIFVCLLFSTWILDNIFISLLF